jgi:hypothetical protein
MMEELVRTEGDGWLLPRFAPPPWETVIREMWGVTDNDDVRWMMGLLTPTPVGHFRDPVRRTGASSSGRHHACRGCEAAAGRRVLTNRCC